MANLINQQGRMDDAWHRLDDDQDVKPFGIVSLKQWQEQRATCEPLAQQGQLGLFLDSCDLAEHVGDDASLFALICINFPAFTDGRGYSAARLLCEQYQYTGELRACGDVLVDQLFFMMRCGFSQFDLRDDQSIDSAMRAFSTFSVRYQGDVHNPAPLFRHRNA